MEERILVKYSLLFFFLSYLFIIYYDLYFIVDCRSINSISLDDLNRFVCVSGSVISQKVVRNNSFFILSSSNFSYNSNSSSYFRNGSSLRAIFFNNGFKLRRDSQYNFFGRVKMDKDGVYLVLDRVSGCDD